MALAGFMVVRRRSIRVAITRARREPFLLFCLILTAVYATAFSSFANFGLLTRQRSLVLPALYVLLAVNADAIRRRSDDAVASPARPEAASARG